MAVYTESFTASNGSLDAAATDLDWIEASGDWSVVDGGLGKTGGGGGFHCCHPDINLTPHHFAKAQCLYAYAYNGPAAGIVDGANFYHVRVDGGYVHLTRVVGYAGTTLANPYTYPFVDGSYARLERVGNSVAVFGDNNTYPSLSVVDTGLSGGTRAGLANFYDGAAKIYDNFSCGDLPAPNLATGLLHYLKLNEASGSVTDVINSKVWTESGGAVSRGTGIQGNAPSFTHGGNCLTSAPVTAITGGFTISCWVKATTTPTGYDGPFGQTNAASWSQGLGAYWSGTAMVFFVGPYGVAQTTGPTVTPTDWNHFAMTWDGAYMTAYTNGRVSGSAAYIGPLNVSDNFLIGALGQTSFTLAALVDEFAIYTRALSHGEIAGLFNFGTPPDLTPAATGNRRRRLLLAG